MATVTASETRPDSGSTLARPTNANLSRDLVAQVARAWPERGGGASQEWKSLIKRSKPLVTLLRGYKNL
jgi:hypothetical protein